MKKVISFILVAVLSLSLTACGGTKNVGNKIPDVFGIDYTDAIEILEAEGYEVKAIETGVDNISEKLLYPLETVDKGSVFKIDEYVLDNNGNLNKNYDVFYHGELLSEDKSIVIYYAKEDYVLEKASDADSATEPEVTTESEITTEPAEEETEPETTKEPETTTEPEKEESGAIGADFKAAMDSYEAFMDEYVAFMKKYKANPTDLGLLMDLSGYLSKYEECMEDFEAWDDEDMNIAETAYYLEVQTRVTKKLLEVAE